MKGLGADGPYWAGLSQEKLKLPRCYYCGRWHWPAPFRCSDCGSWSFNWETVPMEGVLYTWTRTWHRFDGTEALGSPYASLLVELPQAGGIRLLGLGDNSIVPRIGARMMGRVGFNHAFGRDVPVIQWQEAQP